LFLAFARFQEGFREGGLSITQTVGEPSVSLFRPDRMRSVEAGVRFGEAEDDVLSGAVTVSYTRWRNIQADLIEPRSLPTTLNIGNGRIYGFEASARWHPFPSATLNAAIFLNDSGLGVPAQGADRFEIEELPNIARFGAVGTAGWRTSVASGLDFAAEATARYVGRSTVGIGPLDLSQGGYLDASISTRFEWRSYALSLGITNVADARANRVALGNPFSSDPRGQTTPLRPRSVRLGVDARF
jgi:outer membrane receptor protein involved in Fe transport